LYERVPTWALHPIDRVLITSPWDERLFIQRSQNTEARVIACRQQADCILHVFGMCAPVWNRSAVPYAMVLDYTTHLAWLRYPAWAQFRSRKAFEAWLACERRAYQKAIHLFPFGPQIKQSLVEHYGVDPHRVTVVGSSGQFRSPFQGKKSFGSQTILFNGSEFFRKGGDRVLSAFRLVREAIPTARLVVIGRTLHTDEVGVENPGYVRSPEEMERLFLRADLVVAPARCDPYPGFLIEAQNYGVPCITSDVDGMPDIIEHGQSGLVLENCSPKRLAEAIVDLLRDEQNLRAMSQRARERVRKHFCWDTIAATIARTLKHRVVF
jgi:glycosyltransferase involved in cell wall biosynthesis